MNIDPNRNDSGLNNQMFAGPNFYPAPKSYFDDIMLKTQIYWKQQALNSQYESETQAQRKKI